MNNTKLMVTSRRAVRESFGKTDSDLTRDIEILRDWIKTQLHIPEVPSDNMIELFLTMNKFSIERTKQKLDMYYTIRALMPEFYENSHPRMPHMLEIPDTMAVFVPFPKQTKQFHRVFVLKIQKNSADVFDTYKFFSYVFNVLEVRIQHDIATGDVYILDYEHLKLGLILKMTPIQIKKIATIWEKVFSNRIKGVHIVNYPPFIDVVMTLFKGAFKPKIFARIHLHNNIEELYEYIPREVLPKDYGGDEVSVQELCDRWMIALKEHSDRFDQLERMKVVEELRPTPLKNDEILGYHGNFKRLDVD